MAIVLVWAGSVESYLAAGRSVGPAVAPACPRCDASTVFWSGYQRDVRLSFDPDAASLQRHVRIWVRRIHCTGCGFSPGLLPAFCLTRRLDEVAVIGLAMVSVVAGRCLARVAALGALAPSTLRGWVNSFRSQALAITASFASLAVAQGSDAFHLPAEATRAAVEAIGRAYEAVRRRLAGNVVELWRFVSVVSGGELLATNRSPP